MAAKPARVISRLKVANGIAESIFPIANQPRGRGLINSGSSDPRSRSPAVVSRATASPPMMNDRLMNPHRKPQVSTDTRERP